MRRLLSSWLLFAAVWIPAHALVAILIERRVALTRSAFWAAVLVPLVQAVAVESTDRPLLDGSISRVLQSLRRSPRLLLFWGGAAVALAVEIAAGARALPRGAATAAAAALLALAAAALAARGFAERSWRHGLLAAGACAAAAALVLPGAADLLPRFGGPPALPAFAALVSGAVAGALLLLAASRRAPPVAAELYGGAGGAVVAAGLARAVPALLGTPFDPRGALPVVMLLTVAAACAGSAALVPGGEEAPA